MPLTGEGCPIDSIQRGDPRGSSDLDRLEVESIHILREVAAGFRNPVLLYSIGKDSSVLMHLLL